MHDLLKAHQEEWDKSMGCDPERDDESGFNAVYRGHQHDRDRELLKRWIEEELTRLVDMRDDYMNYPPTDTMIDRKAFLEMEIRRLDYLIKQLN